MQDSFTSQLYFEKTTACTYYVYTPNLKHISIHEQAFTILFSKPRKPACCPELPQAIVFSLMYSLLPWTMAYDVITARGKYLRCEPNMYLQVSPDLNAGTHRAHSCQIPRLRIPGGPAVHPRQ